LVLGNCFLYFIEAGDWLIVASAGCDCIAAISSSMIERKEISTAEVPRDHDPVVVLTEFQSISRRIFVSG
jgi:hypothetical protein